MITNDPIATVTDITGQYNIDPIHGHSTYNGSGLVTALTGTGIRGGGVVFASPSLLNTLDFTLDLDESDGSAAGTFQLILDDESQGKSFTGEIFGAFEDFDFGSDAAFGKIVGGSEGLLDLFGGIGATFAASFDFIPVNDTDFEGSADVTPTIVPTPDALSLLALALLGMRSTRRGSTRRRSAERRLLELPNLGSFTNGVCKVEPR